jgi:hypothetical protein
MPLEQDVPQNKRHPPGHFFQLVGCIVSAYFWERPALMMVLGL